MSRTFEYVDGGKTTEVTVTNAAGGSYLPGGASHTPFANRIAVEIQNLGPNAIYVTVDGSAPLATGANGRKIDASGGTWTLAVSSTVVLRAIAATAAQLTTAATMVTELG